MLDQAEPLRLEPLSGPDVSAFSVPSEAQTTIGRASDCDMHLSHPNISRHHALLTWRNQRWLLTDLGSRAGTFLNGLRLEPDAPAIAMCGDLLRLGPFTFRLEFGAPSERTMATADVTFAPGAIVKRATEQELEALAERRLQLLMDGATSMHHAESEAELAEAVLEQCLQGSGFPRAAVLRHTGAAPEVIQFRDLKKPNESVFGFSRSLVKEAASGHVVRLTRDEDTTMEQSICTLGIHSAVCCPILIDDAVLAYIYLDARGTEGSCFPDAVGFCHAVSRLAGLCLGNLMRAELQMRQGQLEKDLQTAREAQTFLGPNSEGTIGHLRYSAQTHPGRLVAGDLFDIFPLDERRVAVCFGDVCGQGMGSAILMTAILSHLRAGLTLHGDPVAAMTNINEYLLDRSSLETFATLFVGVFDRDSAALTYVDAGHGHWLVKGHNGTQRLAPLPESIVIGVERGFPYEVHKLELAAGDRLILYSDGVVEHTSSEGEDFGRERLVDAIAGSPDLEQDVSCAIDALIAFIGGAGLEDDTTLVSIEILAETA